MADGQGMAANVAGWQLQAGILVYIVASVGGGAAETLLRHWKTVGRDFETR